MGRTANSENAHAQTPIRKAAIVILIKLAHEAEKKSSEELKTEIQKALKECLSRIPWVAVEKVIILENEYQT